MTSPDNARPCHWLAPTRVLPHPYSFEAEVRPWSCLREGSPRPLDSSELCQCASCPRWEPRSFDATRRDLVFEAWGVGIPVPEHRGFDEVKRELVSEAWGVK
jgi:hypothetical protein